MCVHMCVRDRRREGQTSSLWELVCVRNIRGTGQGGVGRGWLKGPPPGKEGGGGQRPRMLFWEGPGLLLRERWMQFRFRSRLPPSCSRKSRRPQRPALGAPDRGRKEQHAWPGALSAIMPFVGLVHSVGAPPCQGPGCT